MKSNDGLRHIHIVDKKACCGCTACYAVCPQKAIRMREDTEGFQYPVVDQSKCVNCGLCIKRCPLERENTAKTANSFYAVIHTQENVQAASSSGGVFSALAQNVIGNNGVVYGAAFDSAFAVRHIRTEDDDWKRLRTSKYVQSDMGDVFPQVKADLQQGRAVLFTGTPCQVDGLKNYLSDTDTAKLITCDLICHGVPSPRIWREYLAKLKKETKKEIGKINFRHKSESGWHNSTLHIESADGAVLADEQQSQGLFFRLFFSHLIIRPCCHSCHYANLNRVGDITIGDYWGVERHYPQLDDDKGISLVMVNTPKGLEAMEEIKKNCTVIPVDKEKCMQPNLEAPTQDYGGRDLFWCTYQSFGLQFAGKRMGLIKKNSWDSILILAVRVMDKFKKILANQ